MNNREKAYLNKKSLSNYKLGEISREQSKFEILHFDCFFLSKSYKVSAKKYKTVISHDTKGWYKVLKKNWLVVSYMTREIWWIFTQALKSLKISFRWPVFVQNVQGLSCKKTEKLSFMTLNKIWINPGLVVSKMASGIGWTFIRALRSLKNCTFMGFFCPKHMFQLENVSGIIVLTLKVMQNLKRNWLVAWKMT